MLTFQFIFIIYFNETLSRSVEASLTSVTANFDEERLFATAVSLRIQCIGSLRSCPLPIIPLCLSLFFTLSSQRSKEAKK